MTRIRRFGAGLAEGSAGERALLGNKGANLCEMAGLGLPVPPGFILTTDAYRDWRETGTIVSLAEEICTAMAWLGQATGRVFGGGEAPLLVSVRSGAPVSMPGMMDTILNVGATEGALAGLAGWGSPRFAQDCRRRLIPALAEAVCDLDAEEIEDTAEDWRLAYGKGADDTLEAEDLAAMNAEMLRVIEEDGSASFPEEAERQLHGAIDAVFRSWNGRRARRYRAMHGLDEEAGTAVTVQAMVFGNRRENSATGVAFTRDPNTGDRRIYGEYMANAQGEDVVSGLRTPAPLSRADAEALNATSTPFEAEFADCHAELEALASRLETHFGDAQEIEFTVEQSTLWILQTRTAKRSVRAALRIAVDMAEAGAISREEALLRVRPDDLEQLLHPKVDPSAQRVPVAKGLPASPGAVSGEVVFTPEAAETLRGKGIAAILVRNETSPEDIHGMYAAAGVLTARGGMTSHAAVVARSLGKPCICGAGDARVDIAAGVLTGRDGREIREGDILTIDGTSGEALFGAVPMIAPEPEPAFRTLMGWADAARRMRVRANADTAEEARIARDFAAEGIGLCRTEHAFFQSGRLLALQRLILAERPDNRRAALATLLPLQRDDFVAVFKAMAGLPVCVRLLDPPLHEFLPKTDADFAGLAELMDRDERSIRARTETLREFNPMIGRRGCRIGILMPEIYDMQVRAILQAALAVQTETDAPVDLEIMLPFVATDHETRILAGRIEAAAAALRHQTGVGIAYRVGVMIETPRAALRVGKIVEDAEFISIGSNDLTQMVYGLSRDDVGRFVRDYMAQGALTHDPFHRLDEDGVGELLRMAVERGRAARPGLMTGLCGEHGGDALTVDFCERLGLDYVSCSPYRVPATRLAAAQAHLRHCGTKP